MNGIVIGKRMDDKQNTIDPNQIKPIVKEAIKEWMTDQFAAFGWFSIKAIGSVLFAGLVWFYVHTGGFK